MLVEEFAQKHDLCPAGHDMMQPFLKRTVRDWWEDSSAANRATWLFWLLSRAQLDAKSIVRCACQCAREVPPLLADSGQASAVLDDIQAWCDGRKSRDEARAAGVRAQKQSDAAQSDLERYGWYAVYYVAKAVDSTIHTPGAASSIARAVAQSGQGTAADAEARMAGHVRQAFSWSEIEHAVREGRPSPAPRPATAEEVQARCEARLAEYQKALTGAQDACGQLDSLCREQKFSLDGVSRLIDQDSVGEAIRGMVSAAVEGLEAADSRDAAAPPAGDRKRAPKRGRMMV